MYLRKLAAAARVWLPKPYLSADSAAIPVGAAGRNGESADVSPDAHDGEGIGKMVATGAGMSGGVVRQCGDKAREQLAL